MRQIHLKPNFRNILFILGGILIGWFFFYPSEKTNPNPQHSVHKDQKSIWTCSMHPQIRKTEPGLCPICGMDLIPLVQKSNPVDSDAVHFSPEAAALANVQTSVVSRQNPVTDLRLYGKIQIDERLQQSQTAHVSGRIDKLFVNFTGQTIRKGQVLATIYSPELITAQQELIEAVKVKDIQGDIYQAAKERLRQWKLTDTQISFIENTRKIKESVDVVSTTSGVVTTRRVNQGDYVGQGSTLFDVADLSSLWVLFDAYERDLPFLKNGDRVDFILSSFPQKKLSGRIFFIDPVIDPLTRVSKVRVELRNDGGLYKPEMSATGVVHAKLSAYQNHLVIPATSVLWTGKRSVVYVQLPEMEGSFKLREVELGPALGQSFVVLNGLVEGERIVTQGAFNVDATAQLDGKSSMMKSENAANSR